MEGQGLEYGGGGGGGAREGLIPSIRSVSVRLGN